ncbi:hypothetical protein GCM10025875_35950 [Litorihabitans aurantiacus]|uniref:Uncharacterized protein n=1 Tax=Litorihabitans aurantiacus TaxID=1930061 RepID=A0AA37XHY6_9MICO|nr:hypothetical protein GCM10025875_34830 [Litorihabitans aurantiacus]GMA33603.1 hypothetical protein GCM10025875_35950 [Litorihabitans aurantiacus]
MVRARKPTQFLHEAEPNTVFRLPVVAYDLQGASEASGLSRTTLQTAIQRGDLVARYYNTKPLILADELYSFVAHLPTESSRHRPTSIYAREYD